MQKAESQPIEFKCSKEHTCPDKCVNSTNIPGISKVLR